MANNFFNLFGAKKPPPSQQTINTVVIQDNTSGVVGTEIYSGIFAEEYLEGLRGQDRAKEYAKVRNDYCVSMLLSAVKSPIMGAAREIECAGEEPEKKKHEELVEQILFHDIDLDDYISDALTMLDFGYSMFEESHIPKLDPIYNNDGQIILSSYIGLKQPEWRDPKTIYQWNFDKEGNLVTVTQQCNGDLGGFTEMDAQFLNILTVRKEGKNLEGRAFLRPCYGPWLRKNNYLKLNAIAIEKSMPIPTAQIPNGKEGSAEFSMLKTVLKKFTTHEQNYITYPAGWDVKLNNGTAYDPSSLEVSIDNEDKRMAMAFLANFLLLGSGGGGGSYSLSNDLSDFFLSGELHIAKIIEKSINKYIEKIVILNFGKQDKYPKFKFTGIADKAGIELANMVKILVDGKIIIPDKELEESMRKRMDLPKISEDGQRDVTAAVPSKPEDKPLTLSERVFNAISKNK